jgi:hypothetical protein
LWKELLVVAVDDVPWVFRLKFQGIMIDYIKIQVVVTRKLMGMKEILLCEDVVKSCKTADLGIVMVLEMLFLRFVWVHDI